MPSVSFAQRRVTELNAEVAAAQVAVSTAQASLGEAEQLLEQSRTANAFTRRFRRLPEAEEQAQVVSQAHELETQARSGAAASERELREAERQLAETERLSTELDRWRDFPAVEQIEQTLARDESQVEAARQILAAAEQEARELLDRAGQQARAHVETALSQADATIASAERLAAAAKVALNECDAAIAAYRANHRAEPSDVLGRAEAALARLDALRAERVSTASQLTTGEANLRTSLLGACDALRRFDVRVSMAEDLGALLDEIRELVRKKVAQSQQYDVAALRTEADEKRGRIRALNAETASMDVQLEVVEASVIADATVLATTLTKAYLRDEVQSRRFDTVILDEASMAPIPALWVAACVAEVNLVLVGDPHQLPPIALAADEKNQDAPEYRWLARDVFEASGVLKKEAPYMVKLRTQYRMDPAISAAPNALVYGGELRDGPNTAADDDLDPWYDRDWGHDGPIVLVDTEMADAWCSTVVASGRSSRLNFLSATISVDLAERVLRIDRKPATRGEARIIIATPYRPQARLITLLLRDAGLEGEVLAGTVHSFQGSEAPVVIYDLVVDEPHRRAGLFNPAWDESSRRQFNVGLTRARDRLFVIGDFKFLGSNGKKAFLGALLRKLDGAPRVQAEDVVPVGLSARAAQAQGLAFGEAAEPTGSERVVVTQREFDGLFLPDLQSAQRRVVIYSPFITHNRLNVVGPQLRAAVERDVRVYVVTKALSDRTRGDAPAYRELMRTLRHWGLIVVPKKAMHEKLVFIDDDVAWVGSLNPLSFSNTREIMQRLRSRKIADDFRRTLQLDIAFSSYEQGETSCPICGAEIALAEGDRGTYRRCVVPGCYARSLTDPPLRSGKMACHTCGGELYYGSWGDKPHWRCKENKQHRMPVHVNHLRLPGMVGLLTKTEQRRLEGMFAKEHSRAAAPVTSSGHAGPRNASEPEDGQETLFV
jgi:phosphatidylserine/phosphatidylglycerophosphate/cardiolipin synthase-like enzyme